MEKNTKILLGVAAVVVAYLVLKPKLPAGSISEGKCPAGQKEIQVQCAVAPCPSMCQAI
jgi:hypothetical protein